MGIRPYWGYSLLKGVLMILSLYDPQEEIEEVKSSEIDWREISHDGLSVMKENLLIHSVRSAFGIGLSGRKLKPDNKAFAWVFSEDENLPFSFVRCCDELGVDPEKMREIIVWYTNKMTR